MERILDMKVVHGKREWLCAWKGLDPTGDAWTPSWRPTKDVGKPLQVEFLDGQQARRARVLTIDVSPLDELCQRAIATTQMKELSASFGYVHETPIPAFSLESIAEHYLQVQASRFGVEIKHEWTKDRVHIVEIDEAHHPRARGRFLFLRVLAARENRQGRDALPDRPQIMYRRHHRGRHLPALLPDLSLIHI